MVELHDVRWQATAAIGTRPIAKSEDEIAARGRPPASRNRACSCEQFPVSAAPRPTLSLLSIGAEGVAVGADDVTFRDLLKDTQARREHGAAPGESKRFRRRIAVIEVHLMWLESLPAVSARHAAQFSEEVARGALPSHDALDLTLTVAAVIGRIPLPLVAGSRHSSNLRSSSAGVNRTPQAAIHPTGHPSVSVTLPRRSR